MNWNIIHLSETTSTNDYLKQYINTTTSFTLVYADYQTKGRGQQNTAWHSEPNKNLLCSILIAPYLPVHKNNYISRWISTVIVKTLNNLSIPLSSIKIKWPNDIIIQTSPNNYKKIAGILIENTIENNLITKTIIGIGININQTEFQQLNKTATSVKLITNQTLNIKQVINTLIENINQYYPLLSYQKKSVINQEYIQYLYGWQTEFLFKQNNQILKGKIIDILDDGKIVVNINHQNKTYTNKEIEFLL